MGIICIDGREAGPNKEGQGKEVEDANGKNPRKKHKLTLEMTRNKEKWKAKLTRIFDRTTTTSEKTQMQE